MMLQTNCREEVRLIPEAVQTFCEAVVSFGARCSQLAFVYADNQCRASGGPPFLVEPVTSRDF